MRTSAIFRVLYLSLVNLVYPSNCHVCGAGLSPFDDSPFCNDCLRDICFIKADTCALCGLPLPEAVPAGEGFLCGECRTTKHYFSRALSAVTYDGPAKELIHIFKYSGCQYLGRFFARAIVEAMEGRFEVTGEELVVPVPIQPSRLRERGYNQAGEIGKCIARLLGLKVKTNGLVRVSQTSSQVGMTKSQRKDNVRGSFRVVDRRLVTGKRVFLVDDVYTTGATLDECSKVLLRAGARSVLALTAARDTLK